MVQYFEYANQFPKIGVLKCNYLFKWIEDDGVYRYKRKVWGVNATQNSYTSGVWIDLKAQVYDDQSKFYLPWNPITAELRHDTRIIISMPIKRPWTYTITKVNDTQTKGVITFTVKQCLYQPEHDGVDEYGDAYANYKDYYADLNSSAVPAESGTEKDEYKKCRIVIEAPTFNIKIGTYKVLTAKIYDAEDNDITDTIAFKDSVCTWDFELEDAKLTRQKMIVVDEDYPLKDENRFKCKFLFNGDESYLDHNIIVTCKIDDMVTTVLLDVTAL